MDQWAFPKIQAIKEVRERSACGLKEAKDAVEEEMLHTDDYDKVVEGAINHFSFMEKLLDYRLLYNKLRSTILHDSVLDEDIEPHAFLRRIEEDERDRVNAELQQYRTKLRNDIEDAIESASAVLAPADINFILRSLCK